MPLSDHHDLGRLWEMYERKVVDRLARAASAPWIAVDRQSTGQLQALAAALAHVTDRVAVGGDPSRSRLTMGVIFPQVSRSYAAARDGMAPRVRDRFDELFQQWLYLVYDPLAGCCRE
jgi:hypothetical protein